MGNEKNELENRIEDLTRRQRDTDNIITEYISRHEETVQGVKHLTNVLPTVRVTEAKHISSLDQEQVTLQKYRNSLNICMLYYIIAVMCLIHMKPKWWRKYVMLWKEELHIREFGITSRAPPPLTTVPSNASASTTKINPTNDTGSGPST